MEEEITGPQPDYSELVKAEKKKIAKREKEYLIKKLKVVVNNVSFQGDDVSQNRMGNTMAIANYTYIKKVEETFKSLSEDPGLSDNTRAMYGAMSSIYTGVFKSIYEDYKISWKDSNDNMSEISLGMLGDALEEAMKEVGKVITEKTIV